MFETFIPHLYTTVGTALGGWCGGWTGGYGHGYGMMGGPWPFGMLFTVLFWIAVFAVVIWVIRRFTASGKTAHTPAESHIDILKRRLASGEITTDEFTRLKKTIDGMK